MRAPGPASTPVYDGGATGTMLSRHPTPASLAASAIPASRPTDPPAPVPPAPALAPPRPPPEAPAVPVDPPVWVPASSPMAAFLTRPQPIEPDSPAVSATPMP